jgi:hypothetical protein
LLISLRFVPSVAQATVQQLIQQLRLPAARVYHIEKRKQVNATNIYNRNDCTSGLLCKLNGIAGEERHCFAPVKLKLDWPLLARPQRCSAVERPRETLYHLLAVCCFCGFVELDQNNSWLVQSRCVKRYQGIVCTITAGTVTPSICRNIMLQLICRKYLRS